VYGYSFDEGLEDQKDSAKFGGRLWWIDRHNLVQKIALYALLKSYLEDYFEDLFFYIHIDVTRDHDY
jgi:hypothetical protein